MNARSRRDWLCAAAALLGAPRFVGASESDQAQFKRQDIGPLPAVPLLSQQGRTVTLDKALASSRPLLLNFVFTTCSSSCSIQTAQLVQVRREWLERGQPLQLASITIDPDNDTPQQLARFAAGFGISGEGWDFYTGRFDDLLRVQRHFDVYRGSKAAHPPVLMMRAAPAAPWFRLEGFPSSATVTAHLRGLPARA